MSWIFPKAHCEGFAIIFRNLSSFLTFTWVALYMGSTHWKVSEVCSIRIHHPFIGTFHLNKNVLFNYQTVIAWCIGALYVTPTEHLAWEARDALLCHAGLPMQDYGLHKYGRRQHCISKQLWETSVNEPATTCHLARDAVKRQLK